MRPFCAACRGAGGLPLDDGPEGLLVGLDRRIPPSSVEGCAEAVTRLRMADHQVRQPEDSGERAAFCRRGHRVYIGHGATFRFSSIRRILYNSIITLFH